MLNFLLISVTGLITFAAIALFYHHHLWNRLKDATQEQWALGSLMGLGTAFVMLTAVDISEGLLLDARVLLIGFAGLLGGWRGAIAALAISLPVRLLMGGEGSLIGCLTLAAASIIGLAWRTIHVRLSWQPDWQFLVFGILLSLALSTIFLFPEPARAQALQHAVPPLTLLNITGALFAGWINLGLNHAAVNAARLRKRTLTDELTGLGSRLLLTETVEKRLNETKHALHSFALISVDLDNLKQINDTLGHKVGDAVLIEMSRRLSRMITNKSDLLVRVAGDQFAIMLSSASANEVTYSARQMLSIVREPLQIDQYVILLTASIGVVWSPEDGSEAKVLLQNAEIAMYQSKKAGRNQVTLFDGNMRKALERQTRITQQLVLAMKDGEGLQLAFQPQFRLQDNRLLGAEVLLRWQHPELGQISPAEFVPIAEQAGLAHPLDRFVVTQAAIQQAKWIAAGYNLKLAINLSILSLKIKGFSQELLAEFDKHGIPPALIEIELTESVDLEGSSQTLDEIRCLRAAGITIAMDDFGTGHSSLSYLQQIPLDRVKIDRSFVMNVGSGDERANAILEAIIAMAEALHLSVLAEGVETDIQRQWLVSAGCGSAQGYFFGRPTDSQSFEAEYLARGN